MFGENKKIKVTLELDSKYFDIAQADSLSLIGTVLRKSLDDQIRELVIDKIMGKIEIPKIDITEEEIKDRMLTLMARRVLEDR